MPHATATFHYIVGLYRHIVYRQQKRVSKFMFTIIDFVLNIRSAATVASKVLAQSASVQNLLKDKFGIPKVTAV